MVVGGVALDITATAVSSAKNFIYHTSIQGSVGQTLGGVGRNVAEAAQRTGAKVKFVSVVGDDLAGKSVIESLGPMGLDTKHIEIIEGQSTAVYCAIHSQEGQLITAIADMKVFDKMKASNIVSKIKSERPSFLCYDGNIPSEVMKSISNTCRTFNIPTFFEPTSVPKSLKILENEEIIKGIDYISPNQYELDALCHKIHSDPIFYKQLKPIHRHLDLMDVSPLAKISLDKALCLSQFIPNIITKLGQEGCLVVNSSVIKYFPSESIYGEIKSVTGAGDSFVGTLIANLQYNSIEKNLDSMIKKSQQSAIRTLQSSFAVSPAIQQDLLI